MRQNLFPKVCICYFFLNFLFTLLSLLQEIKIRLRAPLGTALTQRGQKVDQPSLPEGAYEWLPWQHWQMEKGRQKGKSGRALEGKRKCEYWLNIMGDPDEGLNFLTGLLAEFESRGQDMTRSRAAAFFDDEVQAVYLEEDEAVDEAQEQATAEAAVKKEEPRSRSPSCESYQGEAAEPNTSSGRASQRAAPQRRPQATSAASTPARSKTRERSRSSKRGTATSSGQHRPPAASRSPSRAAGPATPAPPAPPAGDSLPPPPPPASPRSWLKAEPEAAGVKQEAAEPETLEGRLLHRRLEEETAANEVGLRLDDLDVLWLRQNMAAEKGLETLREMKKWPSWGTFQADTGPFELWVQEQLERWKGRAPSIEYDQSWPEKVQHIYFCTTCLRRGKQLKAALSLNLLVLASQRLRTTIILVTFGEDKDLVQDLLFDFKWAIDCQLLVLASGGEYGAAEPKPENLEGHWTEALGGHGTLRHWHASRAKNTAHRLAIGQLQSDMPPEKIVLCNLDADNILAPGYVKALAEKLSKAAEPLGSGPVPAVTLAATGPVTGRVALFAKTFITLGGYDEEENVAPSGTAFSCCKSPWHSHFFL